jgi:3-oxoacyl-[acyl-carrier protein] reductase
VCQQAARRLRPGGSLVNFSSSVLGRALPNYTGYAGSKGAVEALTFILAHELRGRDINVNAVAPGPTGTEMFLEGKTDEQIEFFAKAAPLERLGTPSDIAQAVAFLTSAAGHWVNGQTIKVNGGLH